MILAVFSDGPKPLHDNCMVEIGKVCHASFKLVDELQPTNMLLVRSADQLSAKKRLYLNLLHNVIVNMREGLNLFKSTEDRDKSQKMT